MLNFLLVIFLIVVVSYILKKSYNVSKLLGIFVSIVMFLILLGSLMYIVTEENYFK